jgi:hypothetical protein
MLDEGVLALDAAQHQVWVGGPGAHPDIPAMPDMGLTGMPH